MYLAQNMSHLDYFHRLFPIRITTGFCYSYTQDRRFITKCKILYTFRYKYRTICCIVKLPDEVCVSHTKRVGENKTVLQLKQFAEVLLTGFTLKNSAVCLFTRSLHFIPSPKSVDCLSN